MAGLHRKIFEIKADLRIVYIYASYRDSQVFQSVKLANFFCQKMFKIQVEGKISFKEI